MTSVEQFKSLNKTEVSRVDIEKILLLAKKEGETDIIYKISFLLKRHKDEVFFIELTEYPSALNAPEVKVNYKEALTSSGKLRKGFEFVNGQVVKIKPIKKTVRKELKKSIVKKQLKTKVSLVSSKNVKKALGLGYLPASEVPEKAENIFRLPGEIGEFIQDIQPHKELIILKGKKHSSKSQLAMQISNGLGEMGKKVGFIDYEQGGMQSKDTVQSIHRNTSEKGRSNIFVKGFVENPLTELDELANHLDAIVADSITDLKISADEVNALRNKYPETIWIYISQVKENGEMYGGGKMAHNPTKIINCHSHIDFKERYASLEKNRGNNLEITYNMYSKTHEKEVVF